MDLGSIPPAALYKGGTDRRGDLKVFNTYLLNSQEYNDFKSYLPACTGKILASVDYLTQFVKAGITFNAWYKNFYLSLSSLTHEFS
jgi:hypothetical protein